MVSVAVMGYGTVGSGVVEVLERRPASLAARAGEDIAVRYILDVRDFPNDPHADKFIKDFDILLNDPEVRIVIETMGGLRPAYEFVKRCLLAGKSVVTSNKELVAAKGDELIAIARQNNLNFLFEASVGGGIPILRPIDQCLAANEVFEVAGILNGTTNFMLTNMVEKGMGFDEALAQAQQLGYAERDPAADIDGHDACRKICILAAVAFGRHVYPEQVHTEGIRPITADDVQCAAAYGGVIKLIGRAVKQPDGRLHITVAPMVLPKSSLLADVNDVFNGIMVRGDAIGDVVFYGRGAGKLPTASAVVADVIDEVKHLSARKYLFWEPGCPDYVRDYDEQAQSFLVRCVTDRPDDLKRQLAAAFGEVDYVDAGFGEKTVVFATPAIPERDAIRKLEALTGATVQSRVRIAAL